VKEEVQKSLKIKKKKKKKNEIFYFWLSISMAGMLPGVESARRRRFHPSGGLSDSPSTTAHGGTRRSCLSLYPTSHETHHTSISLLVRT
jgi:hypothetical protein